MVNESVAQFDPRRYPKVVNAFREEDKLEADLDSGIKLVDIDVVPADVVRSLSTQSSIFSNRRVAIREFESLYRMVAPAIGLYSPDDQRVTLAGELEAVKTFLTSLDERGGFERLMIDTLGIGSCWISERNRLAETKRELRDCLARKGYKTSNPVELSGAFRDYKNAHHLTPEQVKLGMIEAIKSDLPIVLEALGNPDLDPRFNNPETLIEFATAKGQLLSVLGKMECYHRGGRLVIRMDPFKDYIGGEEGGDYRYFAQHEALVHAVSYDRLARNVRLGKVIPELGIISQTGRRAIQGEGLAQTLPKFLPVELDDDTKIAYLWRSEREYVLNNAQIIGNREGGTSEQRIKEAFEYARGHIDTMDDDEIHEEVRIRRLGRGLEKIYYLSYGIGLVTYVSIAEDLTPAQRIAFFRRSIEEQLTPTGIKYVAEQVKAAA